MSINNILRNAYSVKLYTDVTLNNTLANPTYKECPVAGYDIPLAGSQGIRHISNAVKRITNSQPLHGAGDEVVMGGMTVRTSIGAPFSDAEANKSFSSFTLTNLRTEDQYSIRNWEDVPFEIKVGGVIDDVEMEADEYLIWQKGIIKDFSVTNETINLVMANSSSALDTNFPTKVYSSGPAQGLAMPYIFGSVLDYTPVSLGGGVWQFHSGAVDTTHVPYLPVAYWYKGVAFPRAGDRRALSQNTFTTGYEYFQSPPKPTSPLVTYPSSQIGWNIISDTELEANPTSDLVMTAKVDSEDFILSSKGSEAFSIIRADSGTSTYRAGDFDWKKVEGTNKKAINPGVPNFTATTTGDIDVVEVGGRWLKIAGTGSGRVTLKLEGSIIKSCKLIIRAVRPPSQSVGAFSASPDSVVPSFNIYDSPGVTSTDVFNHKLTYSDLNEDEISFNYAASTDVLLCAIWFEELEIYDEKEVELTIDYSVQVEEQSILYERFSDSAQVLSLHGAGDIDLVGSGGPLAAYELKQSIEQIKIRMSIGSLGGSFRFGDILRDVTVTNPTNKYGVYDSPDETLLLAPRPLNQYSPAPFRTRCSIEFKGLKNYYNRKLLIKARLVDSALDEVVAFLSTKRSGSSTEFFPSNNTSLKITKDWKEYEHTAIQPMDLYIGDVDTTDDDEPVPYPDIDHVFMVPRGGGNNPDQDFKVEIEYFFSDYIIGSFRPFGIRPNRNKRDEIINQRRSTIKIRNTNRDETKSLMNVYQVDNVYRHASPPPLGYFIYDKRGRIKAPRDFDQIVGDFMGSKTKNRLLEAFEDMGVLSEGRNLVDSSEATSPFVGFVADKQKTIRAWLKEKLTPLDYVFYDDSVADKAVVTRRSDLTTAPTDFHIRRYQISQDRVPRSSKEARQTRYIVGYQEALTDNKKTKYSRGPTQPDRGQPPKTMVTSLIHKSDADYIAGLVVRDASKNGIFSCTLEEIGLNLKVAQVGKVDHPDVPRDSPCEIRSVTENTDSRKTSITFKVFEAF